MQALAPEDIALVRTIAKAVVNARIMEFPLCCFSQPGDRISGGKAAQTLTERYRNGILISQDSPKSNRLPHSNRSARCAHPWGDTMRKSFAAVVLAAALAQSASATTFPALTTIYVGTGVQDSGGAINVGTATVFQCPNVSGFSAQVRILILQGTGPVAGQSTVTVAHGSNIGISTHLTIYWAEDSAISANTLIGRGTVNIESTQSGVFCQGYLVDAAATAPSGVDFAPRPREPASRHGGVAARIEKPGSSMLPGLGARCDATLGCLSSKPRAS